MKNKLPFIKPLGVLLLQTGFFSYQKITLGQKDPMTESFHRPCESRECLSDCVLFVSHFVTRYNLQHWFQTNTWSTTPTPYKPLRLREKNRNRCTAPSQFLGLQAGRCPQLLWFQQRHPRMSTVSFDKNSGMTMMNTTWVRPALSHRSSIELKETRASHTLENYIFKVIWTDILKPSEVKKTLCMYFRSIIKLRKMFPQRLFPK